ncbi:hypothetical protein LOK49_Contig115G00005 [Camellia lanceoleosa]|nr:hypothetical protein LOK49_Contig115G00005 [Camellia lanceoleosa]
MSSGSSTSSSPRPIPRRESPWGTPEGDIGSKRPTDAVIELKMSSKHALKVTHLRQFLVLSSSSGNACAQNLMKNQRNHSTICNWTHQQEK